MNAAAPKHPRTPLMALDQALADLLGHVEPLARTEQVPTFDADHRVRHVAELVENGWVRLFALDPQGSAHRRLVPGEGWEPA